MKTTVLVLNQNYTPLSICSVQRAFLLVFLEKADLVHSNDDQMIRTIDKVFPSPSIIKINRYINAPYRGVVLTRNNIFKRDGFVCQYCGSADDLTLDHLIPKSKGGKTNWKNIVTACKVCNAKKGDGTPEEADLNLRRPPFKPSPFMLLADVNGNVREEWLPFFGLKHSA